MKKLKLFNGRWTCGSRSMHGFIAASSKKHAIELAAAVGHKMSMSEMVNYWSACWGTTMQNVQPVPELGVWVQDGHYGEIIRLLDADMKVLRHMDSFPRSRGDR